MIDTSDIATHTKVASAVMVSSTGWSWLDLPYSELAAILTCLVGIAQLIIMAPKLYKTIKGWVNEIRGTGNGPDSGTVA